MSFIFEREAVIFFLGLCDHSDKFPKMFCSSCGGECPEPQFSAINVVSNLILARSRLRRQVWLTMKYC